MSQELRDALAALQKMLHRNPTVEIFYLHDIDGEIFGALIPPGKAELIDLGLEKTMHSHLEGDEDEAEPEEGMGTKREWRV